MKFIWLLIISNVFWWIRIFLFCIFHKIIIGINLFLLKYLIILKIMIIFYIKVINAMLFRSYFFFK